MGATEQGNKALSTILLAGGIALMVVALVLDFTGNKMALRGPMLVVGGFFASPFMLRTREKLMKDHFTVSAVISLFLMVLSIAFMVSQDYNPFLYYRF